MHLPRPTPSALKPHHDRPHRAPSVAPLLQALVASVLLGALAACNGTGTAGGSAAPPPAATAAPSSDATPAAAEGAAKADAEREPEAPRYANVVSVQPVKQRVDHKREECRDETVTRKRKPDDQHQVAGTVIGAVAGGVIGNQIGGGRGRDLTTVAGAIGGGVAGKQIQKNQQNKRTVTTVERRCRTVNEPTEEVIAYDVVYEYLGATHHVRMDHDPGDRVELPVRGVQ